MSRLLTALLVLLLLAAALGLAAWYLAYGAEPDLEGDVALAGLSAPVTFSTDDAGVVTVEAQSEADLFAGLGYAHAVGGAWPMALWRQTADGSLSRWFTDRRTRTLDHHARLLGLGALARETYDALAEDDRACKCCAWYSP
ncbi:MAG: penicillin acylase family protein [Rhodothermales bacterium]|nr:penicillin acylase family protein [Rhodothermales bacterium]